MKSVIFHVLLSGLVLCIHTCPGMHSERHVTAQELNIILENYWSEFELLVNISNAT